jgi:hypothetical protein
MDPRYPARSLAHLRVGHLKAVVPALSPALSCVDSGMLVHDPDEAWRALLGVPSAVGDHTMRIDSTL